MRDINLEVGQRVELECTGDGSHFFDATLTRAMLDALIVGRAVECPGCRTPTAGLPASSDTNVLYENYCN